MEILFKKVVLAKDRGNKQDEKRNTSITSKNKSVKKLKCNFVSTQLGATPYDLQNRNLPSCLGKFFLEAVGL